MHAWERIQLTVDYLEEHLYETPDLEALAKLAALSPFYFQRLFSRLVHKPVGEYVKLRRMARAAEALRQTDRRILDIALECGFASHDHFTRTFKETFGLTPSEYRKHPVALNRMTKPELLLRYAMIDEGVPLIAQDIVLEINRHTLSEPLRFVGLEHQTPISFMQGLGVESGVDPLDELWQTFHARKEREFGLDDDAEELGVAYPSSQEGYFTYFAGGRSDSPAKGTVEWLLPAGEYAVCTFEAERFEALVMDALYKAEQYLYDVWLKERGWQTEPFCAERYASHSPSTTRMEVWVKLNKA